MLLCLLVFEELEKAFDPIVQSARISLKNGRPKLNVSLQNGRQKNTKIGVEIRPEYLF